MNTEISSLDDATALRIFRTVAKNLERFGTYETSATAETAAALKSAFDVSKPVQKASEGDIARLALQWLSEDPKFSANISALMSGSEAQKFMPDLGTITVLVGALVILQTRVKIEKDKKGGVSILLEKKAVSDGLLKPLIEKLLSYFP